MVKGSNPGYAAGIGETTPLRRFAVAMKGARKPSIERRLNSIQGITAGRAVTEDVFGKLRKKKARKEDFAVFVPFADPLDLGKVLSVVTFNPQDPYADSNDLIAAQDNLGRVPLGFVICWLDRDRGDYVVHARPLILKRRSLDALEYLVKQAADLKDWRTS